MNRHVEWGKSPLHTVSVNAAIEMIIAPRAVSLS